MDLSLLITSLFAHFIIVYAQDEDDQFLMVVGGWGGWPSSSDIDLVSLDPDVEVKTLKKWLKSFTKKFPCRFLHVSKT